MNSEETHIKGMPIDVSSLDWDYWQWKEVSLALAEEDKDSSIRESISDCYFLALVAYDDITRTGASTGYTRGIINRLLAKKPLTAITESNAEWLDISDLVGKEDEAQYQSSRYLSLYKYVSADGSVSYSDLDRFICVDVDGEHQDYSPIVNGVLSDLYPITLPYYPQTDAYKVCITDYHTDTEYYFYIDYVLKSECIDKIERYYKYNGKTTISITEEEYTKNQS